MIFFRATQNINIKVTDNSLVKYFKMQKPSDLDNDTIYCTVYDDFLAIKKIFSGIGKKYEAKIISEKKMKSLKNFPKPIGIVNNNEHFFRTKQDQHVDCYLDQQFVDIHTQIHTQKKEITLAVIGSMSNTIGQMVCALSALRILHKTLQKRFKMVKIDLYFNASQNQYYSRDKEIFKHAPFINKIVPLSITAKKLCEYDFYSDMGSFNETTYGEQFNFIDAYLYKFGIDPKTVNSNDKHNEIYLGDYTPKEALQKELDRAQSKGKLLLFHPYSAALQRSIPSDIARKMLQKIILKQKDTVVLSMLDIEKIEDDNYVNLSKLSKSFSDYAYIVSQMDAIITADTATYHIADAYAIPTVAIFTNVEPAKRIEYYTQTKAVQVADTAKSFSRFIHDNDTLTLFQYEGWKKLKVKSLLTMLNLQ
ncbi:MAG: glycosyltransferase family 9 protein [Campylobacterota bacterium]|nr:glycosyltransferase family 9 protein [Campylobacterota bacterium]